MNTRRPILTCKQAEQVEADVLRDESKNYIAITKIGKKTAMRFLKEFGNRLPENAKILVLAGKGHNGADAIITVRQIAEKFPNARITIAIPREMEMKKLTYRAFGELRLAVPSIKIIDIKTIHQIAKESKEHFDLLIEGLIGLSFQPPARETLKNSIIDANEINADVKISMDIPAGASDEKEEDTIFNADVTYANGIAKNTIFKDYNRKYVGRIRYVDIGFFDLDSAIANEYSNSAKEFIESPRILKSLNKLRFAISDKRSYGHLYIFAGSESFPGAALLNVTAALRAGVGLVTAFVPKSLVASFAAAQPSAIWVGCDVNRNGAMSSDNIELLEKMKKPTAILAGSGLTNENSAREFVKRVLEKYPDVPRVLDADAITPQLASIEHSSTMILTPHAGEFLRLMPNADDENLLLACTKYNATIALKSSVTKVSNSKVIVCCTEGGPILSRGGSGDLLAGICGALAARKDLELEPITNATCAAIWLGRAAECAFSERGENAVATSDIAEKLTDALVF